MSRSMRWICRRYFYMAPNRWPRATLMTPFCAPSKILRRSAYKRSLQDSPADLMPLTTTKARLSASLSANALRKAVSPSLWINDWPMTPKLKIGSRRRRAQTGEHQRPSASPHQRPPAIGERDCPGFRRRMFISSFLLAGAKLLSVDIAHPSAWRGVSKSGLCRPVFAASAASQDPAQRLWFQARRRMPPAGR